MARFDRKWKERIAEANLATEEDSRYVDDGSDFLFPIRPGWRWEDGGLWYKKSWELEDIKLTGMEITKRVVANSMDRVTKCLRFTTETQEDFSDGWLQTLNLKLGRGE